jgi:hypothetical protein
MQRLGIQKSNHEAQIQIAVGDLFDVTAAHVAQVTFFAFGHGSRREARGRRLEERRKRKK